MAGSISDYISILFSLIGGIGIFLLGMKFLSDGLQKVAGDKIKTLIGMATNNRFFGVGVGFLVTGVINSSTVVTVLVVSFVDSGLMTLAQAVGVIMGANIGTTLTAWILTIKIDQYGLILAGLGALFYIFPKREMLKYLGGSVLGLGCVFLGLMFMKGAAEPIKSYPEFVAMFQTFQAASYFGVLKCALIGCVLTIIVQSSTATIGITMVLAGQGLVSFETAAALVLGENLGTTITAVIASFGANNNARRAASFHALFNVIGVFYATLLFFPFMALIDWEMGAFFKVADVRDPAHVGLGIAAVHTTFNVINVIVFLLPCRLIARTLESKAVTDFFIKIKFFAEENQQRSEIENLLAPLHTSQGSSYFRFVDIEGRIKRILNYTGHELQTGLQNLRSCIESAETESPQIDQVFEMEHQCDRISEKVHGMLAVFVGHAETTRPDVQQRIFTYERIFESLESVTDYMTQVVKLRLRVLDNKADLLDYQKEDLLKLNDMIADGLNNLLPSLELRLHKYNPGRAAEHERKFAAAKDYIRVMRTTLWNSLDSEEPTNPIVSDSYSNMLTSYRKIRDHLRSYGNAILGIDKD